MKKQSWFFQLRMWFQAATRSINNDMSTEEWSAAFENREPEPDVVIFWRWVYFEIGFNRIACKIFGHDLIDEGFGNPESGCIDISCQRCGWGPGVQWLY
jgi:hypothetical protein